MPSTITGVLIIIFAILPGLLAHYIHASFLGIDWRISEIEKIFRIFLFSVGGLLLYVLVANIFGLPSPVYVIPSTFELNFGVQTLLPIAIPYSGHFIASILIAVIIGYIFPKIAKVLKLPIYPSTWDFFVREYVPRHWVIVSLKNGDIVAGFIRSVEHSVSLAERDIILEEPAQYTDGNYLLCPFQHLFIPAPLIATIATYYDQKIDKRLSEVNKYLFTNNEVISDDKQSTK